MSRVVSHSDETVTFDGLLRRCHAKVHNKFDIPVQGTLQQRGQCHTQTDVHERFKMNSKLLIWLKSLDQVTVCMSTDLPERDFRDGTAHETTAASLLANDTRFFKLRPFTPAHVSCGTYGHGPLFCGSADRTLDDGQIVAMDKAGAAIRTGWCQTVQTPDFYNAVKITRRVPTPTFARVGSDLMFLEEPPCAVMPCAGLGRM